VMMMPFICSCRNKKYTFLQMTYTAENPHADGSAAPAARPRFRPPRSRAPHATSPAPTTTGWREDRCPVVSKRPLHSRDAAKMHIRIGPEPVLAAHAPSPPAAGSNSPAREGSSPHGGTEKDDRSNLLYLPPFDLTDRLETRQQTLVLLPVSNPCCLRVTLGSTGAVHR
jgi:hypothetical protein